jgi:hypothetical protein
MEHDCINALDTDDPDRIRRQEYFTVHRNSFIGAGKMRLAMMPLPDFPSEVEMEAAHEKWQAARQAKFAEWFRQFKGPAFRATFMPQPNGTLTEPTPGPPKAE